MRALSLRARLTLWYTVALVIVLGLFSADILVEQKRLGVRRADEELDNVHATLANIFREELRELDAPDVAAREAEDAMRSLGDEIAIVDRNDRPLATHLDRLTLADVMPPDRAPSVRTIASASGEWRVQARPETINGDLFTLVIARPLADLGREQHELGEVILLVIPLALLLAGAGGWALASIGLRPVRQMARRSDSWRMRSTDLSRACVAPSKRNASSWRMRHTSCGRPSRSSAQRPMWRSVASGAMKPNIATRWRRPARRHAALGVWSTTCSSWRGRMRARIRSGR